MSDLGSDSSPDLVMDEDDGATVICERSNPKAWIRYDTVGRAGAIPSDRTSPR